MKILFSQNSMVGDGFGGRLWYKPTNYTVGSYAAYSICYAGNCQNGINQLYGWGNNFYGELGISTTIQGVTTPTPIPNMSDVKYYSTGYIMGAIKNNNTGWVWGTPLFSTPTQVITDVKFLDASSNSISFVKNDGTVWSIGLNSNGNFGNGTFNNVITTNPIQMFNINKAVRVANMSYNTKATCILQSDSTLKVVGINNNGALGVGDPNSGRQENLPISIPNISKIVDIKANSEAFLALDSNGDVFSWGQGKCIGDGDSTNENQPKKIISLHNIIAISGCDDGTHFLALDKNKNCYSWGINSYGQLGNGLISGSVLTPTLVAANVIDIMAGERFSYIVKTDGSLWCTGGNLYGSIWLNVPTNQLLNFTIVNPNIMGLCNVSTAFAEIQPDCLNGSSSMTVTKTGGQSPYLYNIGSVNQTNNTFTGLTSGIYTVTITDSNSCISTFTCNIPIMNIPTITVNSSTICLGQSLTLLASGANNYTWQQSNGLNSTNGTSVIANPSVTTVYTVTGTNNTGCSSNSTSTVNVLQPPFITTSKDTICIGNSTELIVNIAGTYTWAPLTSLNTNSTSNVIATPSVSTTYTLQSNSGICTFTATKQIVVEKNFPNANYSGITIQPSIIGSNLQLNNQSTNFTSVKWYLCDNTISTKNIISFTLQETGNCCIKLDAYNKTCVDSITKCFIVSEEILIKIPNVFSPNGDGINDFFTINTKGIKTLHCEIYNRWGQKLYEWNDINGFWDGKTITGNAPEGTYFYIVNYSDNIESSKTEKGFLTLFRE
ncbi:MAG: gliding motility-associated C-terminal domain-containing protein [Bacteroidota bacterium]